jgi:hypothetical protein
MTKPTIDPKSTICIWDYWHLPQWIKDFLEKEQITTDDVDWFAIRPSVYKDDYIPWLEMPAFGCCKVKEYPLNKEGDVLVVGYHG